MTSFHGLSHGSLIAVLSVVCALIALRTRAAPYGPQDTSWDGLHALVTLLREKLGSDKVVVRDSLDWQRLTPSDGLLVVYPQQRLDPSSLTAFLERGGRVAILDDYGKSGWNLRAFDIEHIPTPRAPKQVLRNNRQLPFAFPVTQSPRQGDTLAHPVVLDVPWVVLNHGTCLRHPHLTPLMEVPSTTGKSCTFALAGKVGKGKLLVAGDASIAINEMLRYVGNRRFLAGVGEYLLADASWGKRGGKLYLVAGRFSQRAATPAEHEDLASQIESLWSTITEWTSDFRRGGLPNKWIPLMGALLSALALLLALPRLLILHEPRIPHFARKRSLLERGGQAGRIEMLSASTTHPVLLLVELKDALEAGASSQLEEPTPLTAEDILRAARMSPAVDEDTLSRLRDLLVRMSLAELSLASNRPIRVKLSEVEQAARLVSDILERLEWINPLKPNP